MRPTILFSTCLALAGLVQPTPAVAQFGSGAASGTPMILELKKVPVGAWAEYGLDTGQMGKAKMRFALVGRDAGGHVVEMKMEGGPMAAMGGGAGMTVKMTLAPDPTAVDKPVKQIVMQMGGNDPMEFPLNMPSAPTQQKFQKPDPKKLVGKETITTPAGSFKTSHYRDKTEQGVVDAWVSEDAPPMGLVRVTTTPAAGAKGPGGQPMPATTMEIVARGKDAKPSITKPAKPFDPAAFFGAMGGGGMGRRHGGAMGAGGPPGGPGPGAGAMPPPGMGGPMAPGGAPPPGAGAPAGKTKAPARKP